MLLAPLAQFNGGRQVPKPGLRFLLTGRQMAGVSWGKERIGPREGAGGSGSSSSEQA